jgi:hypothetical protein
VDGEETSDIRTGAPDGATGGSTAAFVGRRNPAGLVFAVLCFAVVIGIVAVGLSVLVTSK